MPFNVSEFRAALSEEGTVQSNKYDCSISFPAGSTLNGASYSSYGDPAVPFAAASADLAFRCVAATLPGVLLRTSDINRYGLGVIEKMPFSGAYTDVSMTFLCDRFGGVYSFFYAWLNYIFSINGEETSASVVQGIDKQVPGIGGSTNRRSYYTAQYKDSYSGQVGVTVYDQAGNESMKFTLYKAYPIAINEIPVSWATDNELMKLVVTMTFREWSLADGTVAIKSGAAGPQSQQSQQPQSYQEAGAPGPTSTQPVRVITT